MAAPIWIRESDIRLDLKGTIALLRAAMVREARGAAIGMEKTHAQWQGGNMHSIGAVFTDRGVLGVKSWAHTAKGATPLQLLWDAENGKLLAIIEAFAMGQLRTAGMAGLATDILAAPDADAMAIYGTGKQALAQVAAVRSVRPLKRLAIYGRDAGRREQFKGRVESALGIKTTLHDDPAEAARSASILTLITRAREPFLTAVMPERGTHINAMGAITPERQEFDEALLARCACIAVDSVAQANALAAEIIKARPAPHLTPLHQLVAESAHRCNGADLTLFKSLGVGIADLALAEEILRLARERGVGTELPEPAPVPLSFSIREDHP
jgi:ornithine cyclodeaminase